MNKLTLSEIRAAREGLGNFIVETPVWRWNGQELRDEISPGITLGANSEIDIYLKLELFQHTGTFKPRGALNVMQNLDEDARQRGVTAVSAGNHAIAVAFASQILGTTAKVVMPKTANPFRVEKCRDYGAEVVLVDNVTEAFARANQIQEEEGRYFVHPFEGPMTILGTATVGLEFATQVEALDAVIIPIGGGGLCAGMAMAIKLMQPTCQVFGVEPVGADTMYRSFKVGEPQSLEKVGTIADSLGAPYALPYSFGVCQEYVDEIVLVDDDALRRGMNLLFRAMKLAVEPAGAAATAALCGPLREQLRGKRVGVTVCGANIDIATFAEYATIG